MFKEVALGVVVALSLAHTVSGHGRALLQETLSSTREYSNVPLSNDSVAIPTYHSNLYGPALAPATGPLDTGLPAVALTPVSAPTASASEELPAAAGRRLQAAHVPAPAPAHGHAGPQLAPQTALAAVASPAEEESVSPVACTPLSEILADPSLSQFGLLSTRANLPSQLSELGSNNFTLLVPNNAALTTAATTASAGLMATLQSSEVTQQLVSQSLIIGRPSLESLHNGQTLQTRLSTSPFTVSRGSDGVALGLQHGPTARIVRAEASCTLNVFVTDALLTPPGIATFG